MHGQPVVDSGVVADQPDGRGLLDAVGVDEGDAAEALDDRLVQPVVLGDRVVRPGCGDFGERLLQVLLGHLRIQCAHRGEHAGRNVQVLPLLPLTAAGCDLLTVLGYQASSASVSSASCSQSLSFIPPWMLICFSPLVIQSVLVSLVVSRFGSDSSASISSMLGRLDARSSGSAVVIAVVQSATPIGVL